MTGEPLEALARRLDTAPGSPVSMRERRADLHHFGERFEALGDRLFPGGTA